jgi:5-methylcytosine-specific restriction endonuclease McrA
MMQLPPNPRGDRDVTYYGRIVKRDPCSYCGGPGGTKDHILPRGTARKSRHVADNLTGACLSCNGAKADTDLLGFLFACRFGETLEAAAGVLLP